MFGQIARRRKAEQKKNQIAYEESEKSDRLPTAEETAEFTKQKNALSDEEESRRKGKREGLSAEGTATVTEEMPGMSDVHKRALQESANNQISNATQNQARLASSKMGASGVRGGAANAVQSEIQDKGLQARNQFNRDLMVQNEEKANQQLAAKIAWIQGQEGSNILNDAGAADYLLGERDKNRGKGNVRYQSGGYGNGQSSVTYPKGSSSGGYAR